MDGKSRYPIGMVSWPAFGDVTGEGLELGTGDVCVIVVPDADQTPEQLAGLVPGVPAESQVGRRLAESHCRVIHPGVDRSDDGVPQRPGEAHQPRVRLPPGLRAGPARDRLRGPEGAGPGRLRSSGRAGIAGEECASGSSAMARGGDRAVCRGARPADRGRLRQRLFRRSQRHLATAGGSQRLRPAGAVRRRRGRLADRAAGLDRRGGQGARVRHPAGDRRRAGTIDDARARDREGRGRAGPDAVRRARSGPPARAGRQRTGRYRSIRDRRGAREATPGHRSGSPARAGGSGHGRRSARPEDRRATGRGRTGPAGAAAPRTRPPQPATPRREPLRSRGVHEEARHPLGRCLCEVGRALPGVLRRRGHRPVRPEASAAGRPLASDLRRAEIHGLRGRDGRLPRRHRLRHPALAEGDQGGGEAPGRRLPARPGGPAARRRRPEGGQSGLPPVSPPGWPSVASSRSHRRICTFSRIGSAPFSARPIRSRRRCSR